MELTNPEYTLADLNSCKIVWWKNIRTNGGFGLTYEGTKAFNDVGITYQEFESTASPYSPGFALALDKKMTVPYYRYADRGVQRVRIYDDSVSMIIILYESIDKYLNSIDAR